MAAHKGYLLKGVAEQTYQLTEVLEAVAPSTNLLKGVVERTATSALGLQGTGDFAYPWILAKDGLFKRYTGEFIPAGKAYVDGALLQDISNSANMMRVIFETEEIGQETGLNQLENKAEASAIYYNLHGQRLTQPRSGSLYIERGNRKVIVK